MNIKLRSDSMRNPVCILGAVLAGLLFIATLTSCRPAIYPAANLARAESFSVAAESSTTVRSDGPAIVAESTVAEQQSAPPVTPPDASKIMVGDPDTDGYAAVSGLAGSVPGDAAVALVNLSTRNVMTTTAGVDGDFEATLFAPPGSSLLVKYDVDGEAIDQLWQHAFEPGGDFNYMNPLPGTTIFVDGSTVPGGTPFHSAGFFGPGEGPDWAGWWMSGQVSGSAKTAPLQLLPGAQVTISGDFYSTSPGMNCSQPIPYSPHIFFDLRSMFGSDGRSQPAGIWFNSRLFTPTGLPIEHEADGEKRGVGFADILNLTCLSSDTLKGNFSTTFSLPIDLLDGTYKLEAYIVDGSIPLASGIPRVVVWYHFDPIASLPLITVGAPEPARIPWTLFGDYPVNGHRGVQAEEDIGRYQMMTRTVFPPHRFVIPREDARTQQPIAYRLEPGSNWLSSTDRRFPNPPIIPIELPGGELQAVIRKPDGSSEIVGPAPVAQTSIRMPSLPDGSLMQEGTGHIGDMYHLYTGEDAFAYEFDQFGPHTIALSGLVEDVFGNQYPIDLSYQVMVARVLDLDPAQLPTTPYEQGDAFAPGVHVFPPVPADVEVRLVHLPLSDPDQAVETVIAGQANRFGYFQPPAGTEIHLDTPGEFRVDISAEYLAPDGTLWAGYLTWGNVVENANAQIEAHGRRGMDYNSNTIDDMPPWFVNANLPPDKIGIENYYPYFSGDIHWGDELANPNPYKGDSIHSIITLRDLTGPTESIYDLVRQHYPRATNFFREPPLDHTLVGLQKRLDIGEAPLFITTASGADPEVHQDEIELWGYWYGSSERPDVHVREIISEDGMGTAYWRFDDTYGHQIGEPADGDQPGDMKWEFGGVVFRVPGQGVNEYAIYSSLWVLLPHGCDPFGCTRVTPPFQDATGAGINGGPIMTLLDQDVDMLFLPKGIRPGDILLVGNTVAFSGHVGPPLDSLVEATFTSPSGVTRARTWHANRIGWLYDPSFDFVADEPGRWTVDVHVEHDRPYVGNGVTPQSHNIGSVLGTEGQFEFYVVEPDSPSMLVSEPLPGMINWPGPHIEPIAIRGRAPVGTTAVRYTIHDKGVVMGQGSLTTDPAGGFTLIYDAVAKHDEFPMLSLTAHEGRREGLADEVTISFLAIGGRAWASRVTLIGEEVFLESSLNLSALPIVLKP